MPRPGLGGLRRGRRLVMGDLRRPRHRVLATIDRPELARERALAGGRRLRRRSDRPTCGGEGDLGRHERDSRGAEHEGRTIGERRRALLHDGGDALMERARAHATHSMQNARTASHRRLRGRLRGRLRRDAIGERVGARVGRVRVRIGGRGVGRGVKGGLRRELRGDLRRRLRGGRVDGARTGRRLSTRRGERELGGDESCRRGAARGEDGARREGRGQLLLHDAASLARKLALRTEGPGIGRTRPLARVVRSFAWERSSSSGACSACRARRLCGRSSPTRSA